MKYYKKKVIILIDEYDSPIITGYEKKYYDHYGLYGLHMAHRF